ncbi:response regulator [Myxococcota bacterium]|nr:response regulator [Myxococcota bacterium]
MQAPPKKIMIVDDSPTYLAWVKHQLEKSGYIIIAREEALGTSTEVYKEKPDLILLDIQMPLLKGNAIVPILKKRFDDSLRIVLHSSVALPKLQALTKESGADGYIQKTNNGSDFLRQVALIFKTSREAQANNIVHVITQKNKIREVFRTVLSEFSDMQIAQYTNGADVVSKLSKGSPARLVIIDTEEDEIERVFEAGLLDETMKLEIPVILLSKNDDPALISKLTARGVTHCLDRLVHERSARAAIREALGAPEVEDTKIGEQLPARLRIPISITFPASKQLDAVAWEVNELGAFVFTSNIRATGTRGVICLDIPRTSGLVCLDCEVVFARPRNSGKFPMGMAVSFGNASAEARDALEAALTNY